MGPVTGFTYGSVMICVMSSSGEVILFSNASAVSMMKVSPGDTVATGCLYGPIT